jgi:hypothetical protein
MFSAWTDDIGLHDVGYPIAEIDAEGGIVITKPEGTGDRVSVDTVAEQLVYEIGDPAHYLTPDVDADFSQVTLADAGPDRVAVAGARGKPAPEALKVSLAYADGYMLSGTLVVCGPQAIQKARACADVILDRVRRAGYSLARTHVECLGAGDSLPGLPQFSGDPWEVVLRITAHDSSREALDRLAREFAPLVTSGPPGVTGYTGGRPKPRQVLAYWPTTIDRRLVTPHVEVRTAGEWLAQ